MPRKTMLDRLAGAMKTLGKREGKALTPRQRVAAAQRWNSLADIGEDEIATLEALADDAGNRGAAQSRYVNANDALEFMNITDGNGFRADNPFLSDNINKYAEQSDFLDWCRYHEVEPNGKNLKQFRWETYQTLPYHEQLRIRHPKGYMPEDDIPYQSFEEFPDDFDYMWRY